jgi:hypothetical protein
MKEKVRQFLEFRGKTLLMVNKDGIVWIAIKPICEAIGVNYKQHHANLIEDPILGPASCKHRMQIPNDQPRQMTCLPESLIYGWIFSISSKSPELVEYKRECYNVLFNHFHGSITRRQELIRQKASIRTERTRLEQELGQNRQFVKYMDMKAQEARIGKQLRETDEEEISEQLQLFGN